WRVRLAVGVAPVADFLADGGSSGRAGVWDISAIPGEKHRVLVRRQRGPGTRRGVESGAQHTRQSSSGAPRQGSVGGTCIIRATRLTIADVGPSREAITGRGSDAV